MSVKPRLNSPDHDELVMNLVEMALSRPPEERERYLHSACSDNTQTFEEAWKYVLWEQRMKDFLLDPVIPRTFDEQPVKAGDLLLDRFRIVREVARGGMGVVYDAWDARLERRIAIKCAKVGFRKRLPPEVRHASEISHPNVCKIFEIHTARVGGDEVDFLTMEFLEGETLAARICTGPAGRKEARLIARQLCDGLAEAHRNQVIHGDLKSNNVILTTAAGGGTRAVITDFGLARRPAAAQQETQSGQIAGTPDYMAPELLRGGNASVASDIYALGAILHELATGRHPIPPDLSYENRLAYKPPAVKHPWNGILQRCLDPDPARRYQNAEQVAQAIAPAQVIPEQMSRVECVGREQELNRLWSAFAVVPASGTMWSVSGDAGMGKTTLGEAFLAGVQSQSPGVFIGRGSCSERLAENDAYVPILEALHTLLCNGPDGVAAQVMQATAPTWYRQLAPSNDPGGRLSDSPPATRERMRREIVDFFEELSTTGPIILFLDDLHWADVSTCDLLADLGVRLNRSRIFILMTYRATEVGARDNPYRRLKFDLERRGICQEIALPFLSPTDIDHYIATQFPENRIPQEFACAVHASTEGNPLFMTSTLRFLLDRGVLVEQGGVWLLEQAVDEVMKLVPSGIRSLIRLKLDRLDEGDLQLLTCASVQGVQFDSAVIAQALSRTPAEVEERLQDLDTAHNFVRLVGEQVFPNHTLSVRYQFVHVYYQNSLYASLAPSRRAERSRAVAEALVAVTGGKSRTVAGDVAMLFESGRDYTSAALYFYYASRNAARLFAHPEAASLSERGLRALSSVAESRERNEQELALLQILGLALMVTRGYAAPEVEKVHRRSLELCVELGETRRLMPVLWGLHTCEVNAGNLRAALKLAQQMRDLAESTRETSAAIPSWHALGTTLAFMGRLSDAREALERIFVTQPPSQQSPGSVYLLDPGVTSLSMLARLLAFLGYLDQAMEKATLSVEVANRLVHPQSIAYATFWVGWIHHARGEYDQCCQHLEPAMSLSSEHGLALILEWGRVVRGSALAHLGRSTEGIAEIRKSMANQQAMGSFLERSYCLTLLAEALGSQGANQEAVVLCDEALEFGQRTECRCYEAETYRVRGELLMALGVEAPRVEAEFWKAFQFAQERQCRLLELRAAVSYYRLKEKVGDRASGREELTRVASWFVEGDSCPTVSEARNLLRMSR